MRTASESLACAALDAFGSEDLKKAWLPVALRGERIGAWAFAEAGAGSDAGGVATRDVADGDAHVLNGSKRALHHHGAVGYMSDSPIQRHYRDCKVFELGEGSSELQRNMIARELGL